MDKTTLLENLEAENRQWESLLDEIGEERMEQPGVAGDWTMKDVIAHITGWRLRTIARLRAAHRNDAEPAPTPWPAHLQEVDEINEWIYQTNRDRPLRDVLEDSRQAYTDLVAAIDAFPEEELQDPNRFKWMEGEPISAEALFSHFHNEHEADIRNWLVKQSGD